MLQRFGKITSSREGASKSISGKEMILAAPPETFPITGQRCIACEFHAQFLEQQVRGKVTGKAPQLAAIDLDHHQGRQRGARIRCQCGRVLLQVLLHNNALLNDQIE